VVNKFFLINVLKTIFIITTLGEKKKRKQKAVGVKR